MKQSEPITDMMTVDEVKAFFDLQPLPVEGGFYTATWRGAAPEASDAESEGSAATHAAAKPIAAPAPGESALAREAARPTGSVIICLATPDPDGFFALHRLPIDETYHFYLGDPAELLLLYPDGRSECVVLGPDILNGQRIQQVVSAGVWQGLRLQDGGSWALFGTTMAPGFVNDDYEGGERDALIARYPGEALRISQLTRPHEALYREES